MADASNRKRLKSLGDLWFEFRCWFAWAAGKPKSLKTLSLPEDYKITRFPHKTGEPFEGVITKYGERSQIFYYQGYPSEFFTKPGGLYNTKATFQFVEHNYVQLPGATILKVVEGADKNEYDLVVTYPDAPITFIRTITDGQHASKLFEMLFTFKPKKESLTWMPDPLLAVLSLFATLLTWIPYIKPVIFVAIILFFTTVLLFNFLSGPEEYPPSEKEFREVHRQLTVYNRENRPAFGSSPLHVTYAQELVEKLEPGWERIRDGENSKLGSMGAYKINAYCGVHRGQLLFLVHPHGIGALDENKKAEMCSLTWDTAVLIAQKSGFSPESPITVGVRGFTIYQSVISGTVDGTVLNRYQGIESMKTMFPLFEKTLPGSSDSP